MISAIIKVEKNFLNFKLQKELIQNLKVQYKLFIG
jgi:hypothetical protein